jgi:hypothetical protein
MSVKPSTAVISIWKSTAIVSARNTESMTLSCNLSTKIATIEATCTKKKSAEMMFDARSVRTKRGATAKISDITRYISIALVFN